MKKAILVAIVLFGFLVLTQARRRRHQYCPEGASLKDACDDNKVCAWNKCRCPGRRGCHLICTCHPYKLCYGLKEGDSCLTGDHTCERDTWGKKLVCLEEDLGGSGSG